MKNKFFIIGIFVLFNVIAILTYRYFSPFGKIVSYTLTNKLPSAEQLTTFEASKNTVIKIPSQVIRTVGSTISIKLLSPNIESIDAKLKFKRLPKEIKLGVRETLGYNYHPLFHPLLQDLSWGKIEESGLILWQRLKEYDNLNQFVNDPPEAYQLAYFYPDLSKLPAQKQTATASASQTIIEVPLRGSHSLVIDVVKPPLTIRVAKRDLNQYDGEDRLLITLSQGNKVMAEKAIEDDGIVGQSDLLTAEQEETVKIDKIVPGQYQLDLRYPGKGDDIYITRVEINQPRVSFLKAIFPVSERPVTLWTNSSEVNFLTNHDNGKQVVVFNDNQNLVIDQTGKVFYFNLGTLAGKKLPPYKLIFPKSDIIIKGNGYFSFSDKALLPIGSSTVDNLSPSDSLNMIDFILSTSSYKPAAADGDWLVAQTSFDPKQVKLDGDNLYFSLEVPDLDKDESGLEIAYLEFNVKYQGLVPNATGSTTANVSPKNTSFLDKIWQLPGKIWTKIASLWKKSPTVAPVPKKTAAVPVQTPVIQPPQAQKYSAKVRVLNGGAIEGSAGKFATVLLSSGFINVTTANAPATSNKTSVIFRPTESEAASRIVALLEGNGYKNPERQERASSSAEIQVILSK